MAGGGIVLIGLKLIPLLANVLNVWDIFEQSFGVGKTYNMTVIIDSNIDRSALCIGKTADPLQIVISPF